VSEIPVRPILEFLGADLGSERNGKIRCPFHGDDRHPSASVKEFYYKCFACDAHGDAVRLLVEQGGLEWSEAFSRAEEITGVGGGPRREEPASRGSVSFRERPHRRNMPFIAPRSSR
jgi:DNA primase